MSSPSILNTITCPSLARSLFAPDRRCGLRIVESPDRAAVRSVFEPRDRSIVVGRASEGQGRIDDGMLSRKHLRLRRTERDGELFVEDLGSSNGTYVQGVQIQGGVIAGEGAVVRAGATLMIVDREPDPDLLPASQDADPSRAFEVVGCSFAAERLRRAIATVAPTRDPVLIRGETGTGKEVAARAIHRLSDRTGAFVAVNCAAIPVDLAEAEFFGYRKGAFTGAEADRNGYFAEASGGTLFLDEVGELPQPLQAKLLRVLEDGRVQPLGGGTPIEVDLRIVAATNADLESNGFRSDLLARLGDWEIQLGRLIERRADILPLWDHFVGPGFVNGRSALFTEALLLHDWPQNARALRRIARRMTALASADPEWSVEHLPAPMRRASTVREVAARTPPDRESLEAALGAAAGNVSKVAQELGYDRKQVYRWMERLGLDAEAYRSSKSEPMA